MLESLGLDQNADRLYLAAHENPGLTLRELASAARVELQDAQASFLELEAIGLAQMGRTGVMVVGLEQAVDLLFLRQQSEQIAQRTRFTVFKAEVERIKTAIASSESLVDEVITGASAITRRLQALCAETEVRMDTLAPGGSHTPEQTAEAQSVDLEMFKRGVKSRSVFLASSRKDPVTMAHVEWLSDHGATVRALPRLPIRLILSDEKTAVLPVDLSNALVGIAIHRTPGVVTALQELFELTWAAASPLGPSPIVQERSLSDVEITVLSMVASGFSEAEIAKRLGVVDRTIRRRVESAMKKLNAVSRTEAVYLAAKADII